jgi:prepilin-type N-terminal cleavage/methylation domain-containing protein
MRKIKGFTLIELLIVVAIIAILAAIAVPNFLEAQVRSKVSRVKADQRSLATGIEAYYVDNNDFPEYAIGDAGASPGITPAGSATGGGATQILTFRVRAGTGDLFHTLTTPQAYLTSYFADPFADTKGCIFAYYKDTNGWIVASFGPDTDENDDTVGDIGFASPYAVSTIYNSTEAQPSVALMVGNGASGEACTYDPTNGTVSPGDVYRVKQ